MSIPERELQYLDEGRYVERAELYTADAVFEMPGGVVSRGRESILAEGDDNAFLNALEQPLHDNHQVYVDGCVTVVEGVYRGIHRATLSLPIVGDIAPTNKAIAVPYVLVYELEDGLIRAKRAYFEWQAFARGAHA